MFWWRHLWGRETIWMEGWNVELIANVWAQRKCSSCKHSLVSNNLTKVLLSLLLVGPPQGDNIKRHWRNNKKRCQVTTFMGFWTNLFNGKHVFCTPWHYIVGMQEYNHGWKKPKWKAPRTSRWVARTHVEGGRGWWLELWLNGWVHGNRRW